jgi:hypothetical protein
VAEGDEISFLQVRRPGHLLAEGIGAILSPVEGVQRERPVDERDLGPGGVPAAGPKVYPERQLAEESLGLLCHVLAGPAVALVRELLGPGAVGLAAAVLVVVGDRGVVVAGDAQYSALPNQGNHLVGPRRVADEVAEMVDAPTSVRASTSSNTASKAGRLEWTSEIRAYSSGARNGNASRTVYTCPGAVELNAG